MVHGAGPGARSTADPFSESSLGSRSPHAGFRLVLFFARAPLRYTRFRMRLFLGVDGGQSDTTAFVGDADGRVLGRGTGGPCNHARAAEGHAKLVRAVGDSVAAACAQAGLDEEMHGEHAYTVEV